MPNKDKNIPKRRFKAFENADAWELRKLVEVARFRRGSFPQPYGNSEWYDGDGAMPFVQVADVTDEMNLVGDTKQKISRKAQPLSVFAEEGSVLVTLQGSIGRVAITQYGAFIDRTVLIFEKFNLPVDNLFWAYIIKQKFIEEAKCAPGGTIKTITKEVLSDFDIKLPSHPEQETIGTFFSSLDRHITLHQRKLDKLKSVKQAYLSEMFPAEGERVPKRRFPGFTDAWELRKLGELAEIVRGASPRPIQDPKWFDEQSEIGWLRISDVTEQDGRIYHLEQKISKLGQQKTRVLVEPHLLLSIAATVGKPVVNYVKTGVHDGFLIFLEPCFEQEFMFQWLEMFRSYWSKYGQPGSQVNLNSDLVKKQELSIPTLPEQEAIGTFFSTLDRHITLHQRKS